MKHFKNILVVINSNKNIKGDPALARGITLAKKNNARLTIMDVIHRPAGAIHEYKDIIKPEELTNLLIQEREEKLKQSANDLKSGIDVDIYVTAGRDFIEIVRKVIFGKHDLVIKVANDHPDSFDSSDFHLMRKCPHPVWLLNPKDDGASKKILAAVDLNLETYEEGRSLNAAIMDLATSLAAWEKGELHVLSCWSLYGEDALRFSNFLKVPEEKLEAIMKEEEKNNISQQNSLIKRYESDYKIQAHLIKGDPVDAIPKFSHENDINVVVMGTVARSGIPGLLIGNTAETILHLIDASVITLKPSGFESPIK